MVNPQLSKIRVSQTRNILFDSSQILSYSQLLVNREYTRCETQTQVFRTLKKAETTSNLSLVRES